MGLKRSILLAIRLAGVSLLCAGGIQPVRSADCNGNGFSDGEDLRSGRSADCNLNSNPDECDVGEVNLALEPAVSVFSEGMFEFAAADLDGDGDRDLAAFDFAGSLRVLHNAGNGVMVPLAPLAVPPDRRSLAAADLDADGKTDLAGAFFTAVGVLFSAANGQFDPLVTMRIGSDPARIEAGDVNGDGRLDLVTANQLDNVSVLLNAGGREFAVTNFAAGSQALDMQLADLDADGDLDLAWGSGISVLILWNDGGGRYVETTSFSLRGSAMVARPHTVAAADFDGDGDGDLALAAQQLLFLWHDGGEWREWASGLDADLVRGGDVDADGLADLACASFSLGPSSRFVLFNQGRTAFRQSLVTDTAFAWSLVLSDLDGDGSEDVMAAADIGIERHALRRTSLSPDCNRNGAPDACEADCDQNGIPDDCDLREGALGDCDRNGVPDVCESDCNGNGTPDACDIATGASPDCDDNGVPDSCDAGRLDCDRNGVLDPCEPGGSPDCNANGLPDRCDLAAVVRVGLLHHLLDAAPAALATGDLDGDGSIDLIVGHPARKRRLSLLLGSAGGGFSRGAVFTAESDLVAAGDLDGDGDLDVAASAASNPEGDLEPGPFLFRNHGRGHLRPVTRVLLPAGVDSLLAVDLDRDQRAEIVAGGGGRLHVVELNGDTVRRRELAPISGRALAAADFDGDGDQDLAGTEGLLVNDGPEGFRPGWRGRLGIRALLAADLDGDGDVDVAGSTRALHWNDGSGQLLPGQSLPPGAALAGLAVLDSAADGDLDIAGVQGSAIVLFPNQGQGRFETESTLLARKGSAVLAAADLDGDRHLELVVAGEHGLSILEPEESPAETSYPIHARSLELTDLDGDSDLDLAAAGEPTANGTLLRLFEHRGPGDPAAGGVLDLVERHSRKLDGGERAVEDGDLDGDGAMDLVVADRLPGGLLVLANRTGWDLAAPREIATPGGPDLVVASDLDGDGDTDLATGGPSATGAFLTTFLNDGGSGFIPGEVFAFPPFLKALLVLDGDRDGDLDLAAPWSRFPDAEFRIFVNTGRGDFEPGFAYRFPGEIAAAGSGDLDGDGDIDLISAAFPCADCGGGQLCDCRSKLLVLENDGAGSFRAETSDLHPAAEALALADLDGDADLDLLVPHTRVPRGTSWVPGFEVEVFASSNRRFEAAYRFFAGEGPFAVLAAQLAAGPPDAVVLSQEGFSIHRNRTATPSGDGNRNGIPDECEADRFRRGDADADGVLTITDAIHLLRHLFAAGGPVRCQSAADADDGGSLDLTDAVAILLHLFAGGALPPPAPGCGVDPTADGLSCSYPPCA